ncbi:RNA polymerase subunit sigma [Brachybacterium avium]|uniref:RNA polymerase subunit sigma n=1 Tax=Brachybacterium avium TaxID=2017485 RepID=A0A220UGL8_9MICO|nr:sigma-70 family RNA polymerase sigma factor [Brachybacterium avium]ASK66873.1 RNA polymerase subunit sigma [Brachybacterium avium]
MTVDDPQLTGPPGAAPVASDHLGSSATGRPSLTRRTAAAFTAHRSGEVGAMDELVEMATPLLWHIARAQGLERETARDAVQTAWLRVVEKADHIEDPLAVLGWLVTTTRREAWRLGRQSQRTAAEQLHPEDPVPDPAPEPADHVALDEERSILWRHVTHLSARCRELLRVIAFSDRPDYASLSETLQMPVGSIGPTRGRCLARLRASLHDDPSWGEFR